MMPFCWTIFDRLPCKLKSSQDIWEVSYLISHHDSYFILSSVCTISSLNHGNLWDTVIWWRRKAMRLNTYENLLKCSANTLLRRACSRTCREIHQQWNFGAQKNFAIKFVFSLVRGTALYLNIVIHQKWPSVSMRILKAWDSNEP